MRLSPHTSAISGEQQEAFVDKFFGNLEGHQAGLPLEDVVDDTRLARDD